MLEPQKYRPMPESQPHTDTRLHPPTGRHNALLKELRRTVSQGALTADDCFLVEGVRLLEEALRSGVRLHTVFFSQSAGTRVDRLLPQINKKVETLLLPEKTFNSIVAQSGFLPSRRKSVRITRARSRAAATSFRKSV